MHSAHAHAVRSKIAAAYAPATAPARSDALARLERAGARAVEDHELLALVGVRVDAATLAAAGGLRQLLDAPLRPFLLDNRHRIIAFEELFRGTVDGVSVHPREVVRCALRHNAAAIVLCHNHPSGIADPRTADRILTDQLVSALAMVEVRVLDHLVIGDGECVSFSERGLL